MEKAVLGGYLWYPECRAGDTGLPSELPTSFDSVDDYISCYEALVLEEARAILGNSWAERVDKAQEATISRCVPSGTLMQYQACDLPYWPARSMLASPPAILMMC